MYKFLLPLFILFCGMPLHAQIRNKTLTNDNSQLMNGRMLNDTLNNKFEEENIIEIEGKTHYTDYKIISFSNDTTIVDTTLSLQKEKLFNYIRKNSFELLPLHNLGQTFNNLGYDFNKTDLYPKIGVNAKQFNFIKTEEVEYYRVPTPTTELFFQTGIQQGQVLNSLMAMNINPQLNISAAFKGLRSLGNYRSALASHQNFSMTASYNNKTNKYFLRAHYAGQNLMNQENAGLTTQSIFNYITDNKEYRDRNRLETNILDAESRLKTRRYYLEQGYNLWYHPADSITRNDAYLQVGHKIIHEREFYTFDQGQASAFFGDSYNTKVQDSTYYFRTNNVLFTELKAPWVLGKIRLEANYSNFSYGYNSILYLTNSTIPRYLRGHNTALHAKWDAGFKTFGLTTEAGNVFEGKYKGSYLSGTLHYKLDSLLQLNATLLIKSESPSLNKLLYQSAYIDYNWRSNFENEQTRLLKFSVISEKLLDAEVSFTQKDFYTYFDENATPMQYNDILSYLKINLHKEVKWRKWALDNTVMYQKVAQGSSVLRVPNWVAENTFYFSDDLFKNKPMYLQTGITVKYFTKYLANEFNPVINEFVLQNTTEIGNYPLVDYFVNARIQRTRVFFKLENISSLWKPGQYFVTPTQPYRDFTIRFGLVWNFFI